LVSDRSSDCEKIVGRKLLGQATEAVGIECMRWRRNEPTRE
jgi:hypothetical protein